MFENTYFRTAIILAAVSVPAYCQESDIKKLAIVDIDNVDRDFAYMGEYQGSVKGSSDGQHEQLGLQLVAMGNGEFGGMSYDGGLPGTGWNRDSRSRVKGVRHGALLTLSDGNYQYELVNDSIMVQRNDGVLAGELLKVSRQSATLGMEAPANAYTLFDGDNTRQFKNGEMTDEGLLKEGTELISRFRDFTLHAEFRLPYMPHARGQGRSNSGLYLQSSYEVQVLDSFGLEGVENQCGALYRYRRPALNMCLPPLTWQTYDLTFLSPRFNSAGEKIRNARITVLLNGVAVHDDFEVERKTGAGKPETDTLRPIKFQDHSNPVRFRNIWLIDLAAQ